MNKEQTMHLIDELRESAKNVQSDQEMRQITSTIARLSRTFRVQNGVGLPSDPAVQAREIDNGYIIRPHIDYLSKRIAKAVEDVENGISRKLAISMPPRAGKSTLVTQYAPLWIMRRHPEWNFILSSYSDDLSTTWARRIRRAIENNPGLGIALEKDAGSGSTWTTIEGGEMFSKSDITGRGAKVFIIDDPVRDFVDAHSPARRDALWNRWLSVSQTRLEPVSLTLVVMTRWHEDDFVGRLFSDDWEGDPDEWERISIPAIAEKDDLIGREQGDPLFSPMANETYEGAVKRWNDVQTAVGSYTFASMYQQRPAPSKGAVFDSGWWRFWTTDPNKATEDGRIKHVDPSSLTGGTWCDSWDATFKGNKETSDFVVGQRWVRYQANRFLITQNRGRKTFTQTIVAMEEWALPHSLCGNLVHTRLIEDAANGPAIIDVLKDKISGIKPITVRIDKVTRARAVTPEVESGNVYLPHPSDPGNEWVADLLSELRNFPHDSHDDQVDSLTQALMYLRDPGKGGLSVPGRGRSNVMPSRNLASAAMTDISRRR